MMVPTFIIFSSFYTKTGAQHPKTGQSIELACLRFYIYRAITFSTFLVILDLFKHIFEHIKRPLSGLSWTAEIYKPEGVLLASAYFLIPQNAQWEQSFCYLFLLKVHW